MDNESSVTNTFDGCRAKDFLLDGVICKQKFFAGFDIETILFIDEHEPIPIELLERIKSNVDTLIVRKHSEYYRGQEPFDKPNDINYLQALSMARGDIVAHFDQDCAAFTAGKEHVENLIRLLEQYSYVSYPSRFSPVAVKDPDFDHMWTSTRFFLCKRTTLDFTEIEKCLLQPDYMWDKYGHKKRKLSWMEHVLGIISNSSVYYPPIEPEKMMLFCWNTYINGVLPHLNSIPYSQVFDYVKKCKGIHYPADVTAVPI